MDWLREARIPGLPVWSPSGGQEVDALLQHMVIAPGQGPTLRDKGLAELVGKEAFQINRDADDRRIKTAVRSQLIGINTYVKDLTSSDGRGEHRKHPERLYSCDSVLAFLDACSPEYLGTDASDIHRKTDLKRLVIKAFDHCCQHMDTSPFRARLRELETRLSNRDRDLPHTRRTPGGDGKHRSLSQPIAPGGLDSCFTDYRRPPGHIALNTPKTIAACPILSSFVPRKIFKNKVIIVIKRNITRYCNYR